MTTFDGSSLPAQRLPPPRQFVRMPGRRDLPVAVALAALATILRRTARRVLGSVAEGATRRR